MARPKRPPTEATEPDGQRPLPVFRARHDRERAALDVSRSVVGLFLRDRTTDFSVKELADHAGVSERTFYRYFPRKEDVIRPYVEAGVDHIVAYVRDAPRTQPLRDVLAAAHAELLDTALTHGGGAFLALIGEHEALRAVWVQVLTDAEDAFAQVIAEWLGIDPDSVRARLAGAVVVTAGRLALRNAGSPGDARSPSQVFSACLDLVGPALFHAPTGR